MAYFIEYGLARGQGFYSEIAIVNINDRSRLIAGDGVDHQLLIHREFCDYGSWNHGAQLIASNSNGLITTPVSGVIAINIPPMAFCGLIDGDAAWWGYYHHYRRSSVLHFALLAVPADPTFTQIIATGTISFGDRPMACPRIKLGAYPLYPNAPSATGTIQVAQLKQQLAKIGELDAVEAALAGPTDPATISWNTGGAFTSNGPLGAVVASVLGYDPITMGLFLTAAGNNIV